MKKHIQPAIDLSRLRPDERAPAEQLEEIVSTLLNLAGVAEDHRDVAAEGIVYGQLRGSKTHGIFHLPTYVKDLRSGAVNPNPDLSVEKEGPAMRRLDGDNGLGVVVGTRGMDVAIAAAEQFGIGGCSARQSNHFGLGAFYVQRAARRGVIGLAFSNASPTMAPWGGRTPILGTNPVAMGFPLAGQAPLIIDMASSSIARARLRKAAEANEEIPDTWALNPEGRPTADAREGMAGTVQPFGGAKGYAIALAVELLCASLVGDLHGWDIRNLNDDGTTPSGVSHFFLAIDVRPNGGRKPFAAHAAELAEMIRESEPAAGNEEVRLPGDRVGAIEADHREHGIPVDDQLIAAFEATITHLG